VTLAGGLMLLAVLGWAFGIAGHLAELWEARRR
jgi:hypothetical protein